ncbi:phosphotyrosine protein phosphatase [Qipengyuania flava]|uniref:phosphotyrosine protein phosphatase n=1 Tax=Qipengyuania aestuarii TaxID=2867241 RepID=UPI001CD3151E|nr:phosphotyrosine protein phosphatase [Qipengyuania aestuarii]MCA0978199.1 phosphotyrosine protein phosphatase [Qipengyuania flava]
MHVLSAGTASDAEVPLDAELVGWADRIFCMEQRQRKIIRTRFPAEAGGKSIVNLGIPDRYRFMDPALVELLQHKLDPYLRR